LTRILKILEDLGKNFEDLGKKFKDLCRSLKILEDLGKNVEDPSRSWQEFLRSLKILQRSLTVFVKILNRILKGPHEDLLGSFKIPQIFHQGTIHRDHVTCTCRCYKYKTLCKHSLCVAQTVGMLKKHVDFAVVKVNTSKKSRTGLGVPTKYAAGKKGGTHKNAWRPQRQERSHSSSEPANRLTKIHHNNRPLKVCFPSKEDIATDYRQCGKEFPRRQLVIPFDNGCTQIRTIQASRYRLQRTQ